MHFVAYCLYTADIYIILDPGMSLQHFVSTHLQTGSSQLPVRADAMFEERTHPSLHVQHTGLCLL